MTPFDVAYGLAEELKADMHEYEERLGASGTVCSHCQVYAGFLPKANNVEDMKKLCPAIAVRPQTILDEKEQSTASIVIFVSVYDKSYRNGSMSLFHILEFVRARLLMTNPVSNKYWIQPGMRTTIPDNQPWPQWLGAIEFDVMIPRAASTSGPLKEWTR